MELPDLNEESDLDGYVEEEDEDFEFSESELERATRPLRTMKTKSNWTKLESVVRVKGRLTKKKMMKKLIKE